MQIPSLSKRHKLYVLFVGTSLIIVLSWFFWFQKTSMAIRNFNNESQVVEEKNYRIEKPVKILFVGDMMFDRHIREISETKKDYCYPLEKVTEFLNSFDAVVGNNEGAITSNKSISANTKPGEKNNFYFTFDPQITSCYQKNNIEIVSLGNNHSTNFGSEGVVQTTKNLSDATVGYFGDPRAEENTAIYKNLNEKVIAFISYNYSVKFDSTISYIKTAKEKADIVVVYAHWGTEYAQTSNAMQKGLAHAFVDAGADVVIGMHPHVIQEEEIYKEKHIFYSLGNFVFDQYFSEPTKKGLGVAMEIDVNNELRFERYHFQNASGQVMLLEN